MKHVQKGSSLCRAGVIPYPRGDFIFSPLRADSHDPHVDDMKLQGGNEFRMTMVKRLDANPTACAFLVE
jgi:hypothetical protein